MTMHRVDGYKWWSNLCREQPRDVAAILNHIRLLFFDDGGARVDRECQYLDRYLEDILKVYGAPNHIKDRKGNLHSFKPTKLLGHIFWRLGRAVNPQTGIHMYDELIARYGGTPFRIQKVMTLNDKTGRFRYERGTDGLVKMRLLSVEEYRYEEGRRSAITHRNKITRVVTGHQHYTDLYLLPEERESVDRLVEKTIVDTGKSPDTNIVVYTAPTNTPSKS